VVWKVLVHQSSAVAFAVYKDLLDRAARLLRPFDCRVVFLADRGFADTALLAHLTELGWQWRICVKGSFWIYRRGRRCKAGRITPAAGQALFWHNVFIPTTVRRCTSERLCGSWVFTSPKAVHPGVNC
jgi:hypothetical protein